MDQEAAAPMENGGSPEATVPLLLSPAYARCKSVVNDELRNFRIFLQWCALDHSSGAARAASYAAFFALALAAPAAVSLSLRPGDSSSASAISSNQLSQLPASGLAAISFLTLAASFRGGGGLRRLLFLDGGLRDDTASVRRGYARELDRAFRLLALLLLPSLCAEVAHKVLFFWSVQVVPPVPTLAAGLPWAPWRAAAAAATVASWVYRTGVFLLVCVLFRLTCELQILRFDGIHEMFDVGAAREGAAAAAAVFREHQRVRTQLLATSHRYRVFIIGCLVTITVSQLGALLLLLSSKADNNFANSGDILVGSSVQLSGFLMCLIGAARITHRAQRIVSVASHWNMKLFSLHHQTDSKSSVISTSDDTDAISQSHRRLSDGLSAAAALREEPSTYESRHALVTYLQHNSAGITLFGFALDRGLLHTLFVFEMTLVLWILSKVVVLS